MKKIWLSRWTKILLGALCLVPLAHLLQRVYQNDLTANPIEYITHYTGDWTMGFLLITLAITPLRAIIRQPQLIRFRRMLGLMAFFYGCLHLATWIWLDKDFDIHEMWVDIIKRRFITVGMTGLLLMTPLAVTSTAGWVRRLGFRRWQLLHRAIYLSTLAGVIHYYWLVKSNINMPLLDGGVLALLLAWRVGAWLRKKHADRGADDRLVSSAFVTGTKKAGHESR
jgi:sulfoxide reductase heme-binding subunit YedZ